MSSTKNARDNSFRLTDMTALISFVKSSCKYLEDRRTRFIRSPSQGDLFQSWSCAEQTKSNVLCYFCSPIVYPLKNYRDKFHLPSPRWFCHVYKLCMAASRKWTLTLFCTWSEKWLISSRCSSDIWSRDYQSQRKPANNAGYQRQSSLY